MKKIMAFSVCLMLICVSACAQVLPDAGVWLDVGVQQKMTDYVFSQDYVCDVWIYPRDNRTEKLLAGWIMQALDSGYIVSVTIVEGQRAYRLEDENGLYALMFSQYQGKVMLMLQQGMHYAPDMATPTPRPTLRPTLEPNEGAKAPGADTGDWGWIWVEVEKDCPFCVNGRCSNCNGTGAIHLYGETVSCDRSCVACDGLGTYTTQEYQYVRMK